jgi:hypothetical protein
MYVCVERMFGTYARLFLHLDSGAVVVEGHKTSLVFGMDVAFHCV